MQLCYIQRYQYGLHTEKICSTSTENTQEDYFHYDLPNLFFPPFYVFLYLQELFFNNESLSRRAAGEKTRKYCSYVHCFRSHNQKADKTTWPLYSQIRTKKKTTFDWSSIFGLRQSIYCKCLCLHCWNAINTLKGFSFFYNPTKTQADSHLWE